MPRRSKRSNPETLRKELVRLLWNFKEELKSDDLRSKAIALIPAYDLIRDLGSSLIPDESATAARDRILYYLRKYPKIVIRGEEISVVAGISEWARRLRELRVQFGWAVINGLTAKEMHAEGEFLIEGIDVASMKPDDYILLDDTQDRDAAYRWNTANEIRRRRASMRDKILEFLRRNVDKPVTGEELRYVAGNKTEWARRIRELRTEQGWPVVTKQTGRPDLPVGVYLLQMDRQSPPHDRNIPDKVRGEVLRRDSYRCTKCRWSHDLWNPSDPRFLELHHLEHHADGGENVEENLTTLCNICHDDIHRND